MTVDRLQYGPGVSNTSTKLTNQVRIYVALINVIGSLWRARLYKIVSPDPARSFEYVALR